MSHHVPEGIKQFYEERMDMSPIIEEYADFALHQEFVDDLKGKSELKRLREMNAELLSLCKRLINYTDRTEDCWGARELKREAQEVIQKAEGRE